MTPDDAAMRDTLARWLEGRLDGVTAVEIMSVERPASGYSAETLILPTKVRRGDAESDERFVLRRETPDPAVYPQQAPALDVEMDIQYAVDGRAAPALDGAARTARRLRGRPRRARRAVLRDGLRRRAGPDREPRVHAGGLLRRRLARRADAHDRRRAPRARRASTRSTGAPRASTGSWRRGRRPSGGRRSRSGRRYAERELAGRVHPPLAKALDVAARARRTGARARAVLGRSASGQHHLARLPAGLPHRLRGRVDRATGARSRVVAHVRPLLPRGRRRRPTRRRTEPRGAAGAVRGARATGPRRHVPLGAVRGRALLRDRRPCHEPPRGPRRPAGRPDDLDREPAVDCLVQLLEG